MTPIGAFRIIEWFVRPDFRGHRPSGPTRLTRAFDGWCDDPAAGAYNRLVRKPIGASHEDMWRADGKYHVVGVLDVNFRRRAKGGGSAIFFHLCESDYGGTAGCVAVLERDMRKILPRLARSIVLRIV